MKAHMLGILVRRNQRMRSLSQSLTAREMRSGSSGMWIGVSSSVKGKRYYLGARSSSRVLDTSHPRSNADAEHRYGRQHTYSSVD